MRIKKFEHTDTDEWNAFVQQSKNGNFQLERGFIKYHKNRFEDHSLLFYDDGNSLIALLPGIKEEQNYYSHKGLTLGGFILPIDLRLEEFISLFKFTLEYLIENGFQNFYYKTIPSIYHKNRAEEDLYLMFLANAKLIVRHVNPVIDTQNKIAFQERRKRAIKKATKEKIEVKESDDYNAYWNIITELLAKYGPAPVHSLEDILYLKNTFPLQIKLIGAYQNSELLAGVVIFESETVAKMQYIGSSEIGKNIGALDLVFDFIINQRFAQIRFIDFGTSTVTGGKGLSIGISNQKEGFGARTTVHDQYCITLTDFDFSNINQILT